MRKLSYIIIFLFNILFGSNLSWTQTEIQVECETPKEISQILAVRFSLVQKNDTISVFDYQPGDLLRKKTIQVNSESDSLTGILEYRDKNQDWHSVQYTFNADTTQLKRLEVQLAFAENELGIIYLKDFTVDRYLSVLDVELTPFQIEKGASPIFTLVSHSASVFRGHSETRHFYGTIALKGAGGWNEHIGSYCTSAQFEKPLTNGDTVYSWIPSYHPGEEYVIQKSGTYRYRVVLEFASLQDGIQHSCIDAAGTRKRTRVFGELEETYRIE